MPPAGIRTGEDWSDTVVMAMCSLVFAASMLYLALFGGDVAIIGSHPAPPNCTCFGARPSSEHIAAGSRTMRLA